MCLQICFAVILSDAKLHLYFSGKIQRHWSTISSFCMWGILSWLFCAACAQGAERVGTSANMVGNGLQWWTGMGLCCKLPLAVHVQRNTCLECPASYAVSNWWWAPAMDIPKLLEGVHRCQARSGQLASCHRSRRKFLHPLILFWFRSCLVHESCCTILRHLSIHATCGIL